MLRDKENTNKLYSMAGIILDDREDTEQVRSYHSCAADCYLLYFQGSKLFCNEKNCTLNGQCFWISMIQARNVTLIQYPLISINRECQFLVINKRSGAILWFLKKYPSQRCGTFVIGWYFMSNNRHVSIFIQENLHIYTHLPCFKKR